MNGTRIRDLGRMILLVGLLAGALSVRAADAPKGDASAGESIVSSNCAMCHGSDGNSTDGQYPKLAGQHADYIVYQLKSFQSGTRSNSIMSGMAGMLSPQDIADVAAYMSSQTMSPGPEDTYEPELGKQIYDHGLPKEGLPACASCHGPKGVGDAAKMYPRIGGQHAQYVVQVLTGWHNGKAWGNSPHAKLVVDVARKLTSEQIHAVASYVQGLNAKK